MDEILVTMQEGKKYDDKDFDLDRIIFDLNSQIELLSSQADTLDYLVSIGSGIMCGLLDIFWVGEFDLARGREIASERVDKFVVKMANMQGYKGDDIKDAVQHLEKNFPLAADGNIDIFGGGKQHHLRDFAHHPTLAGLFFSLLTQFTEKAYGTNTNGQFIIVDIAKSSKKHIGKNIPEKVIKGTIDWFFHLVSDMAGSNSTAGLSGGTGIPGPILSLAKELSTLSFFKDISKDGTSISVFVSKLFNGTLLAKRDEEGRFIKDTVLRFDLRGELGVVEEFSKQAIPVVANECIVRSFFLIRRLGFEIKTKQIEKIRDFKQISWADISPVNNPTIDRMLLISAGVFTTIDIGAAVVTKKYFVAINYVGVGRFAVAIGKDVNWYLKARDIKAIKEMYQEIMRNIYRHADNKEFERFGKTMGIEEFGLNVEQTEILYNLEYYKTLYDVITTKATEKDSKERTLKKEWLGEWKNYITKEFASFIQIEGAALNWYAEEELIKKVEDNFPEKPWFLLVLFEALLFEPYFPLSVEKNKKGKDVPSTKYKYLQGSRKGYKKARGDEYLGTFFTGHYYAQGDIKRLRKSYNKAIRELNEVVKLAIKSISVTAVITTVTVLTAGAFAPSIAVTLVGSNFAGLNGIALVNASLAYLGGGAIAAGGMGMAGGTAAIAGGGALLGLGTGVGSSYGGIVLNRALLGKENTLILSAKLLVAIREIFVNDDEVTEHYEFIYDHFIDSMKALGEEKIKLEFQLSGTKNKKKKEQIEKEISRVDETLEIMNKARNSMQKSMKKINYKDK